MHIRLATIKLLATGDYRLFPVKSNLIKPIRPSASRQGVFIVFKQYRLATLLLPYLLIFFGCFAYKNISNKPRCIKLSTTLLHHNIRPYADLEAMLATSHKAMVVAATGAGKTSVAVKYLEDHNLQGLVICPKVSICQQWDSVSDNVATMTYQKFCNEPDVSAYDCYIFDEAHHTGASKWGKAVKTLMDSTTKPVIGLTADPKRYLDGGRDMGGQHFFEMLTAIKQIFSAFCRGFFMPWIPFSSNLW